MKKFFFFSVCFLLVNMFGCFNVLATDDLISGAVSGLLMDADSGRIIYEKDIHKKVSVASMTKMMGQIIIMEKIEDGSIKWDDIVTVSKSAQDMGGSQIYIEEGEKISIRDLMKGISMASGNDATVMMAEVISGSEEKFVKLMNKKAKELGLKNTVSKNSTGLDEEGHYSTSYDMAIIARELITKHPDILKFSSVYEDYLREGTDKKFWLVNTNKLVHFYEGADGLKTGHTDNAGYCLAATAKRNNLRLIAIVLGEESASRRNSETMKLLDYGFSNLKTRKLLSKNKVLKKIKVDKATHNIIEVILKEDLFVTEDIDFDKTYEMDIVIDEIVFPVKKGDVVGKVVVYYKNKIVKEGILTVKRDVNSLGYFRLLFNEFRDLIVGEF